MFQLKNQEGLSPVFVLLTAVVVLSITGFTMKYVNDGQKELDDEISLQEDLVSKSNVDIIKKDAVTKNQDGESNETTGWHIYRNEEYGVEIKYPKDFFVQERSVGTSTDIEFADKQWQGQQIHYSMIFIESIITELSPAELVAKKGTTASIFDEEANPPCTKEKGGCEYFLLSNQRDDVIGAGKLPVYRFSNTAVSAANDNTMIQDAKNGRIVNIARHTSSNGEVPPEIYSQMLSTFKFIGPGDFVAKTYSPQALPKFEDFPVADIYQESPVPIDLSTPNALNFKTRLTEGVAKGPNFAGHYTVVTWGCGTSCVVVSLVDAKTGAVHMLAGLNPWAKLEYRLDSSLIIENGDEELGKKLAAEHSANSFKTNYANWQADKLSLVYSRDYSK